jgi:hypothetical protein
MVKESGISICLRLLCWFIIPPLLIVVSGLARESAALGFFWHNRRLGNAIISTATGKI